MKKILIAAATAAALLAAGASASPAFAASTNGSVKGHVRTFSGKAINDATVVVYKNGGAVATKQTITSKTGRYQMALKPGVYTLVAKVASKKYATSTKATTFTVTTGVAKRVNKRLYAASAITGRVKSDTGAKLDDITVTATGINTLGHALPRVKTTTDSTGAFYLRGLTAGTYKVAYKDAKGRYLPANYQPSPISLAVGQKHTGTSVRLSPSAKITGRAFVNGVAADDQLGRVVATLTNLATDAKSSQLVHPTFKFYDLAPGDYKLTLCGGGNATFIACTDFVGTGGSTTLHVTAGQAKSGLVSQLSTTAGAVTPTVTKATVTPSTITAGAEAFDVAVATRSYNSPAGADVTLQYGGTDQATSTLSTAGTTTFHVASDSWVGKPGAATVTVNVAATAATAASTAKGTFTVR